MDQQLSNIAVQASIVHVVKVVSEHFPRADSPIRKSLHLTLRPDFKMQVRWLTAGIPSGSRKRNYTSLFNIAMGSRVDEGLL